MLIKLTPEQVPIFWEPIKTATIQADEVPVNDRGHYLNELLNALLNETSQCFVRLNDEKRLLGLLVTKILANKITGEKSIFVTAIYSWALISSLEWEEYMAVFKAFVREEQCRYVAFESRQPRIWEVMQRLGFKEVTRRFSLEV